MSAKKPLLCRFGVHTSTFRDSALVASAYRCNRCDGWVDRDEGERVERVRAFLSDERAEPPDEAALLSSEPPDEDDERRAQELFGDAEPILDAAEEAMSRAERDDNESPLSDAASEVKESGSGLNSDGDDGRSRAIEAAHRDLISRRYWTQSPGGRPVMNLVDARAVAEAAIDAALASGHLIVRDDRHQCGGIGVCEGCTEQFERLEHRVRELEAALEPFARLSAHVLDNNVPPGVGDNAPLPRRFQLPPKVNVGELRRARAALSSEREASA